MIVIYPLGVYARSMIEGIKRRAVHRTRILQGQIKGLEKMIEQEQYCMEILTQSLAIQKSLASLNKLILENHLQTHIQAMFASGDKVEQQRAIAELLSLYELHTVRSKS